MKPTTKEYRRPLLTARQVGMVAALGGLGFTWRALGLIVPLPGLTLGIRWTLVAISAFAGGPYVALLNGVLFCLPSPIPLMLDFPMGGLLLCVFVKTIWKHRGSWGYILLALWIVILMAPVHVFDAWFLSYVAKIAPFWPMLVSIFSFQYWVYCLQMIIPIILLNRLFPDFMRPRWSWRGGEIVEETD